MNVVDRAKAILLTPKTEWVVIEAEPATIQDIYRNYLVYIAAVPVAARFLGLVAFSHASIGRALAFAIVSYVLALAGVYVLALIIDKLAPTFGGRSDMLAAFKLAAYSATAGWLAGIFDLIPALSILSILGLYSLYLFYLGLPVLMKAPPEKTMVYTVAVIVAAVVLYAVIGALGAGLVLGNLRAA